MLYITSLREIEDMVDFNLIAPELPIYDSHLVSTPTNIDTNIHALGECLGKFGTHYLLMNPVTASWALVNEKEKDVYLSIKAGASLHLSECSDFVDSHTLTDFVQALFKRGLARIDGLDPFRTDMYSDGLPYHDALLVELLVTERCNMECLYCQANASKFKSHMTMDIAKKTIEHVFLLDHSTIIFELSGGEPLLNFPLIRAIVNLIENHSNSTGKFCTITLATNGLLLAPDIISFIKDHNIKFSISLDGPEDLHELSRPLTGGKAYWYLLRSAIDNIQKQNVPFGVVLTVNKHNYQFPERIAHFLADLSPSRVKINPVARVGKALQQTDICISSQEYLIFMQSLFDYMLSSSLAIPEFNISEVVSRLITRFRDYRCMRSHCNAGITYLVIDPLGRIYPCAEMTSFQHTKLGNVMMTNEKLDILYQKNKFVKCFNSRSLSNVKPCCYCDWRRFCEGGCVVDVINNPNVDFRYVHSANCEFYIGMYHHVIETLSTRPDDFNIYLKSKSYRFGPGWVVNETFFQ